MANRQRIRVGREVSYFPTDAEATAGGGSAGDSWFARIALVAQDGSANLNVVQSDGTELAVVAAARGQSKGQFDLTGGLAHHA